MDKDLNLVKALDKTKKVVGGAPDYYLSIKVKIVFFSTCTKWEEREENKENDGKID